MKLCIQFKVKQDFLFETLCIVKESLHKKIQIEVRAKFVLQIFYENGPRMFWDLLEMQLCIQYDQTLKLDAK